MAIKVTTDEWLLKPVIEFPKLMKNPVTGTIVFFKCSGWGMVVVQGNATDNVGEIETDWNMNNFEDYNEPLTIQND